MLLWQAEWPALAAAAEATAAHAACPCRGTTACCCQHAARGAESHAACPLHQAASSRAGDCRLESAGCQHTPLVSSLTHSHDDVAPVLVLAERAGVLSRPRLAPSTATPHPVFRDPLFVPPERSLALS